MRETQLSAKKTTKQSFGLYFCVISRRTKRGAPELTFVNEDATSERNTEITKKIPKRVH